MPVSATALRASLTHLGDRPLLFDLEGRSKSAAEVVDAVDRVAGALGENAPARPRVGLWYRNSFAALEAFLAVEWLGGTRIPVDPSASPEEARSVFAAARVDLVLADGDRAQALGGDALIHDVSQPLVGKPRAPTDVDEDRVFMIYPRSVTQGELFGIPLSYRNWRAILATNIALYRSGRYGPWQEASEVFLSAQQIMHGTGFLGTFVFLALGLPQVIADTFDADRVLAAIERHRVTATMVVPAMLKNLLAAAAPGASGLRSLRHLLYGGGPMSAEEVLGAAERLGPALTQVYGRVEGGWPLTILGPAEHVAMRSAASWLAKSCGRPIAEVTTRLRPLPGQPNGVGELAVKSAMTSAEYVGPDGWCSLGDVMKQDQDGYLYYERRLDRMINTGYHVYPGEIEAIIGEMRGVSGVRVVGEPHPRWGEMVVAYIVPSMDSPDREFIGHVQQAVSQRLAKYKVPREFRIVKQLPP